MFKLRERVEFLNDETKEWHPGVITKKMDGEYLVRIEGLLGSSQGRVVEIVCNPQEIRKI